MKVFDYINEEYLRKRVSSWSFTSEFDEHLAYNAAAALVTEAIVRTKELEREAIKQFVMLEKQISSSPEVKFFCMALLYELNRDADMLEIIRARGKNV